MWQIGVGTPGGAEALAIFHHLLYDELDDRLIQGTAGQNQSRREKLIEWKAVREAMSRFLPKHTAWKHRNLSYVVQEARDVDGSVECSLAVGMVAAETRGSIAARQAAGTLPWIGVNDPAEVQRLPADHAARLQESANFQVGGPEKLTGPHDSQHTLQKSGGLSDQGYMDDVILVLPFLQDLDVANARVGAERNPLKTEVIYNVTCGAWRKHLQSLTVASHSESLLGLGSSSRTSS